MNRREFMLGVALGAGTVAVHAALGASPTEDTAPQSFSFCVATDPHCSEGPKEGLETLGTGVDKFLRALRMMEAIEGADRPDFVLVTGDIHPQALEGHLGSITIPIHPVPGNHESDPAARKALRALFPADFHLDGKSSDYYSFLHKGARFIGVCDAGKGGEHIGQFCSENIQPSGQCEWLESELSAPELKKFVFAHIPPERHGEDRDMHISRNDSRWFNQLVREKKPTALFFGHLHQPTEEYLEGESRMFVVRSCGWNFDKKPVGFLHVSVTQDGIKTREIETGRYA